MRSTGEVLGIADSFGLAYLNPEATQSPLQPGNVLISVSDEDKRPALEIARI